MRILFTADIHVHPDHLQSTAQKALAHDVDALIVGGDVVPHDLPRPEGMDLLEAQAFYLETELIPTLKRLKGEKEIRIYLDLGNDDLAACRRILETYGHDLIGLLHMQQHALSDRIDLLGYMIVPPTPFARKDWEKPDTKEIPYNPQSGIRLDGFVTHDGCKQDVTLDIYSDETIAADMDLLSARITKPFILVAHSPPYDTPLDQIYDGTHVGSRSIRCFIEEWGADGRLVAALHGHIHESPLISGSYITNINNTMCINPGQGGTLHYTILDLDQDQGTIQVVHSTPE